MEFVTIKKNQKALGEWCKLLRKQEKLTQYDLASELDLSPITISKLENGENTTLETVLKSYNILMKSITLINLFKVK